MPPTPTSGLSPNGTTRPWVAAAVVSRPAVDPASAQAARAAGSISMARIADRSISSPPSVPPWPARL
jgi:hypothetical protein